VNNQAKGLPIGSGLNLSLIRVLGHFFASPRLTSPRANRLMREMELKQYFESLLERLENSDIQNNGKDRNGFFEPTRDMLFQKLSMLRDLHTKPNAKPMLKSAWEYIVTHVPPEWLVLSPEQKRELKKMLD
jgi:hypothetical protein